MATNKRRKVEVVETSQPMSAFALRKRLLASAQPKPAIEAVTTGEDETSGVANAPREDAGDAPVRKQPKRTKKKNAGLAAVDNEDVQATPAVPHPNTAAVEPPLIEESDSLRMPNKTIEAPAPQMMFSSLKPTKATVQKKADGKVILRLADGERVVVLGSYGIRVTDGEISVNGATLKSSTKVSWVQSPTCHALPIIRCSEDAVVELHPDLTALNLREMARLSPYFRRLWNDPVTAKAGTTNASRNTFQILYTSSDGPKGVILHDLVSPPEWNKLVATLLEKAKSKPISVMVTGPKSSGKSTLGKILTNRLITRPPATSKGRSNRGVAVLDLDPGQPEYHVPGQIALLHVSEPILGPSFCHSLPAAGVNVVRAHTVAAMTPASDPGLYIEATMDLINHYRNTLGALPLIVNTPGWVQGTGLDILTALISELRPSEVVYMSQTGPAEAVESLQEASKFCSFSTLPSQTAQLTARTAAHLRSMHAMSYFHAEVKQGVASDNRQTWNPKPLTTVPPLVVTYSGQSAGILGVMCYDYQTPPDLLADTINGTLVAIVEVENVAAFRGRGNRIAEDRPAGDAMVLDSDDANSSTSPFSKVRDSLTTFTPEGIPFITDDKGSTLDPKYSHTIGLALVRGIDVKNAALHILTPVAASKIEELRNKGSEIVLISGKFDSASWAYTEDLYYRSSNLPGGEAEEDEIDDTIEDSATTEQNFHENNVPDDSNPTSTPWIEVLQGNQRRGAGSKIWRVRRDLGRIGNATD